MSNSVVIYTPQGGSVYLWVEKRKLYSAEGMSSEMFNWLESEGFCDALLGEIREDICTESKLIEEALKS
jgi:hypothetical protein